MLTENNTSLRSNPIFFSARDKTTSEVSPPRDVFTHLYLDATKKQQRLAAAEERRRTRDAPAANATTYSTSTFSPTPTPTSHQSYEYQKSYQSYLLGSPSTYKQYQYQSSQTLIGGGGGGGGGAGVRRGSGEASIRPGITLFETSRRLEALARPRDSSLGPPASPNYGRLLNFTEEEAHERERRRRRTSAAAAGDHRRPRSPSVTIPIHNPRIDRLATPRRYTSPAPTTRRESLSRSQKSQSNSQRPLTSGRCTPPPFRFK